MWPTETPGMRRIERDFSPSVRRITWYQVMIMMFWGDDHIIIINTYLQSLAGKIGPMNCTPSGPRWLLREDWDVCLLKWVNNVNTSQQCTMGTDDYTDDLLSLLEYFITWLYNYLTFLWFIVLLFQLNGTACCSDTAISFHYISPPMLYVMYYLVYHLR